MREGLPKDTLKRCCLKCDKPFESINGYRLCDQCRYQNRYISGGIEEQSSTPNTTSIKLLR